MLQEEIFKAIPTTIFFKKMISNTIGGGVGFDIPYPYFLFALGVPLINDESEALFFSLLEQRTDDEIASYYYAIYAEMHISNQEYQTHYEITKQYSTRLASQMQRAYSYWFLTNTRFFDTLPEDLDACEPSESKTREAIEAIVKETGYENFKIHVIDCIPKEEQEE
jgi:hypothetical protein